MDDLALRIKNINWKEIANDWFIIISKYRTRKNLGKKTLLLDPYLNCSKNNPLYMHKKWLEYVYNNEELQLSDRQLAKICRVTHPTIRYFRKKYNIPTKKKVGRWIDQNGYIKLYMTKDYQPPEIGISQKSRVELSNFIQFEHILVMEQYLAKHPELEISKRCLLQGKYLKTKCRIHHINYIRDDNRLKNLWLFETEHEHNALQSNINQCFSDLIKLRQIYFEDGIYYLDKHYDCKHLDHTEIRQILKQIIINQYKDLQILKEAIKDINWDEISDDWTVSVMRDNSQNRPRGKILLNPYSDCSRTNPLYIHKNWLEYLFRERSYGLSDSRLSKICNVSKTTISYWRRKNGIHYQKGKRGFGRFIKRGRDIYIQPPLNYENPFKDSRGFMLESRYVMEQYLAEHLDWDISNEALLDWKYLKPEYFIHHINLDSLDNRLENLFVCRGISEHNNIHSTLNSLVYDLLNMGFIFFKDGQYYLFNNH